MHFIALATIFLTLNLASSQPFSKRDAPTVLSDISKLRADISSLATLVSSYSSSNSSNHDPLITATSNLRDDIHTTTKDTDESPLFTSSESSEIANALQELTPEAIDLILSVKDQAMKVAEANLTGAVKSTLSLILDDSNTMFHSIEGTVTIGAVSAIDPSQQQIEAALKDTIAVYS